MRESHTSHENHEKLPISQYALKDLLQSSLLSSPAVSVTTEDLVTEATNLLPHHLETFTDSLVVVEDEKPVGLIGGLEILEGVLKNPDASFFAKTRIKEIMSKKLIILDNDTTLGSLLDLWKQTGRAFALIPNEYHGYSAVSARKLLEVAMSCKTKLKVGDVSKRKIITFRKDQKVKEIIESMFANKTRKLVLEGTSEFISDRIIIQKISRDLNCLQCADNFLEMKGAAFVLDKAKKVSDQMALEEGCKLLYEMQSPYLLLSDGVVTPWDVIMSLTSEDIQYNWKSSKR
ncbi:MAG: CBS domain-containing protein [Thaumarchaeota archaeon]|nr:CBS domain-containing protein [Nitrososphaerota archaeon]